MNQNSSSMATKTTLTFDLLQDILFLATGKLVPGKGHYLTFSGRPAMHLHSKKNIWWRLLSVDCLRSRTVTATVWMTPGHDGSIFQNGSKSITCGLNLHDAPELISNRPTVTATVWTTPGND